MGGLSAGSYDLVLLIDVIEHFERDEGESLVREALRVGKAALISTPKRFFPQTDVFGNPYEIHRSFWTVSDLKRFGNTYVPRARLYTICVISANHPDLLRRVYPRWQFWKRR